MNGDHAIESKKYSLVNFHRPCLLFMVSHFLYGRSLSVIIMFRISVICEAVYNRFQKLERVASLECQIGGRLMRAYQDLKYLH